MPTGMTLDAIVVGGGVHGLASAYHLFRLGCRRVALVERFHIGNRRGSSHGLSRITRSSYDREVYVRLMRVANEEEWPRLEKESGRTLIHRRDGCFFGPAGGPYESFARAVARGGADVEPLDLAEARRRFPMFRFPDAAGVLHDRTAGVIAAEATISALRELCMMSGIEILERTRVLALDPSRDPVRVETDRGDLHAGRVIVTGGPWAGELLPFLRPRLTPIRQTVGYFRLSRPPDRFPVWAYLGAGRNLMVYGLPEVERDALKAAWHVTSGVADDPEREAAPDASSLAALRAFLAEQIVPPLQCLLAADTCFYTCTATEDYVIDLHPENPRIAIGAGFSGHGFKLAPVTGRILAELALQGRSTVGEFEANRSLFAAPTRDGELA
jgi:sarcosine oxidase